MFDPVNFYVDIMTSPRYAAWPYLSTVLCLNPECKQGVFA